MRVADKPETTPEDKQPETPQKANVGMWIGAGIGAGIGSAAIAAALLYATRSKGKKSAAKD